MTMSLNLQNYLKVYDVFDKQTCGEIIEEIDKFDWEPHYWHNEKTGKPTTYEDDIFCSYGLNSIIAKKINGEVIPVLLNQYYNEMNLSWFNNWNNYSNVLFHKYEKNSRVKNHWDFITTLFDGKVRGGPILSLIGLINDGFTGGEMILWENQQLHLKPGQIVIFPSTFLYPHEILPVTSGTRYSFVSWAW